MTDDDQSAYSVRYVAFLDLLGFTNIVRASATSPKQSREIASAFKRTDQRWKDPWLHSTHEGMNCDFQVQSFSDCTVMSVDAAAQSALHYLLIMATQYVLDMMSIGLLVRGGITKGQLHHSDAGVFGPALLDAYSMEQTIADFPRIVVDRATHLDFQASQASTWDAFTRPALRYDADGPVYLHIFSAFEVQLGEMPSRVKLNASAIRMHVQNAFNNSIYTPGHYRKIRWLAMYWNDVRDGKVVDLLEPIEFPNARDFEQRYIAKHGPSG